MSKDKGGKRDEQLEALERMTARFRKPKAAKPSEEAPAKRKMPRLVERVGIQLTKVPLEEIGPNPDQPRREFDEAELRKLAASMEKHGLLQPIVLVDTEDVAARPRYFIVAGERRYRAAKLLGWGEIDALVIPEDRFEGDRKWLALIENAQRRDLTPVELGDVLWDILREGFVFPKDVEASTRRLRNALLKGKPLDDLPESDQWLHEILEMSGVDFEHWRRRVLPTLFWPEPLKDAVRNGRLSYRKAEVVARFPEDRLEEALEAALAGASEDELRRMLREARREPIDRIEAWKAFAQQVSGARISIKRAREAFSDLEPEGRAQLDELEGLANRLAEKMHEFASWYSRRKK